jgi:hypothetical protein
MISGFKQTGTESKIINAKNIKSSNKRENLNIIKHKYDVGDFILLRTTDLRRKLLAPKEGPYTMLEVGINGTVKIQRGIVHERVNIHRTEPFFEH